jgi:ribosomal protein L37AE/L43A
MYVIATTGTLVTGSGVGVSTQLVDNGIEVVPPGDSAMQQLRGSMRAVLARAASDIPELSASLPQILTMVGDPGRRGLLGSFAKGRWELGGEINLHQIFVSGHHLTDDVEEVAVTLIHELAHLLAAVRGIKDTSNRGRYHSKRFKECAEELGLDVDYRQPHGFYAKGLSDGLRRNLFRELADLRAALVLRIRGASSGFGSNVTEAPPVAETKKKYVTAACGCPAVFRMAVGYWKPQRFRCEGCGEYFVDLESQPSRVSGSAKGSRRNTTGIGSRSATAIASVPPLTSITTTSKEIK